MSMMIGVVLSNNISKEKLDDIRSETGLALLETNNEYIKKQLESDESFFQATTYGVDSDSGICAYDLYTKDLTPVYKTTTQNNKYFLEGLLKLKKEYYEDASKWVSIIKTIKNKYKIERLGIIYFFAETTSDEIKLDLTKRTIIKLEDISVEVLMKMKEDTLTFFE